MQRSALCRSRRELSNAYLLPKFRFDTAENEPANNLQNYLQILRACSPASHLMLLRRLEVAGRRAPVHLARDVLELRPGLRLRHGPGPADYRAAGQPIFSKILAKFRSFSAVSAPIFSRKYAFCSIFQNLPDYLAEVFENQQKNADFATSPNIC